eukprot:12424219-Karenia_brevis.AAC.1
MMTMMRRIMRVGVRVRMRMRMMMRMMKMIATLHAHRKFCDVLYRGTCKKAKGGEPHHSQGQKKEERAEKKTSGQ